MSYELTLQIQDNSVQERNIEDIAEAEHVSREEAALKLLARPPKANTARSIVGAFKQDAALMDEVLELAMQDRQRRSTQTRP